ncbi:MAG: hypothetical protein MJ221_03500 [Bacilli bacterium]|nr:hypothetical protein [Bacilli bacterium]
MAFELFKKDKGHLARTRKEQFGYVIRNNIPTLFMSNVLMFLFSFPLILTFVFFSIAFHQLNIQESPTSGQFYSIFLISGGLTLISVLILNIGLLGQYSVIKELVFLSSSKFVSFFKGIKNNFKDTIFVNLIFSLMFALLVINVGTFLYASLDGVFKLVILIINISVCLVLLIGKGYINFEMVVFKNRASIYIRNGIYLFYKNLPMSLVELLLVIIPFIAVAFVPIQFCFIPIGIIATCYLSFSAFSNFMISITVYERLFTPEQIPEIYHKGLEKINL